MLADSYYANAVDWAVENGVTNGIGDGLFGPNNSCTRARMRYLPFRAYPEQEVEPKRQITQISQLFF